MLRNHMAAVAGGLVLAVMGAAAAGQSATGADTAAIAKIRTAYQTAAAAQDAAALAKLFAPDGVEMPPDAPAIKGRAAIEAFHKAFAGQWMIHGMTITPTETRVIGDAAYDIGTYKQGLMPRKGGTVADDKGKYVVLLKKDANGAWWITHAIYNSDAPMSAPPAKR